MYNQIESNKRKTNILIIIFCLFIISVAWLLNNYLNYGYEMVIFAVLLSIFMSVFSYFGSDKIALASTGAKKIIKENNPQVYRLVENLCITAGIPTPQIYIINSPALNAFATGRDPKHASIALTSGIINALENEELEGVIAHELSHIKNYDIRLMTIVVVLVGTLSLLADMFYRIKIFGGRDSENKNNNAFFLIFSLILLLISPLVANLIKLAISRKREYLADADGAMLTRYPEGLARALEKINSSNQTLKTADAATAHLFIANPFNKKSFLNLFSTHPPIDDRIKKLRGI
ncbi:MAG: M48 family metallopeptidase [Patescibacteria group bacterium]